MAGEEEDEGWEGAGVTATGRRAALPCVRLLAPLSGWPATRCWRAGYLTQSLGLITGEASRGAFLSGMTGEGSVGEAGGQRSAPTLRGHRRHAVPAAAR